MIKGCACAVAFTGAMLTAAPATRGETGPRRDHILAALEQRARTGTPRHLDHDEGEELQLAVAAALKTDPNDTELAWAATRASFAAVPRVSPAIYDAPPSLVIQVLPRFALPWTLAVTGAIEISIDGGGWLHAADLSAADTIHVPLGNTSLAAARPGFHVVRLRALLTFRGKPATLPETETRELPACTYGITGASPAGQRVGSFLHIPTGAIASDLEPTLPGIPLDAWLRTLAPAGDPPPIWTAHWCEDRSGTGDRTPGSLCARTMVGSAAARGEHAEVWLKIADVDVAGDRPAWTAVRPTLQGIDLIAHPARTTVDVRDLAVALRSRHEEWPRAALSLDARAIDLSPATPKPGEPVTIRAELRNTGTAALFGLSIDVLAFDTRDRDARIHRRYVRTIPAGESVTIETSTTFPLGFGGVVVTVLPLSQDMEIKPLLDGDPLTLGIAARLVRPDLAPPGYADLVRSTVGCQAGCANVR